MSADKKGRAFWHNYKAKCIYLITLKKSVQIPSFGDLTGDPTIAPGQPGCLRINLSPLGKIVRNAIYDISKIEPKIRLFPTEESVQSKRLWYPHWHNRAFSAPFFWCQGRWPRRGN